MSAEEYVALALGAAGWLEPGDLIDLADGCEPVEVQRVRPDLTDDDYVHVDFTGGSLRCEFARQLRLVCRAVSPDEFFTDPATTAALATVTDFMEDQ